MPGIPIAPEQASSFAMPFDVLFYTISILVVVFTLLVLVMVLYLVKKYKRGNGRIEDRANPMHHNTALEAVLAGIPLLLGLGIFGWGTHLYVEMRTIPKDAMEIFVIGKRWMWHIQHTNGIRENNELHVPVGVPVKLTMISQDVVHAFYVPQFRAQYHVVPGRYTTLWFKATKEGKFNLFCAMHCGTQHSEMGGYVYALSPTAWAKWMANGGNRFKPVPESLSAAGKAIFTDFSCGNCHGAVDSKKGPSLNGIYGSKRIMSDGSTVIADFEYLRQSILDPESRTVRGYLNSMRSYKENLSEEKVMHLVEYLKTLGSAAPVIESQATPAPEANPVAGGTR
jgi:cytochrome c oxidase subunit II